MELVKKTVNERGQHRLSQLLEVVVFDRSMYASILLDGLVNVFGK